MKTETMNIAVLGGGSFGTAISNICADNAHNVCMWLRDEAMVDEINNKHVNTKYLPDYPLNSNLRATTDLALAVRHARLVFIAVPSKASMEVCTQLRPLLAEDALLISCTKGIEEEGFRLMSQLVSDATGSNRIGVLSGPNLAREIAARQAAASVIASEDSELRSVVQQAISCDYFRVYANQDVFGVELAGALKNIYAISTGMSDALELGFNTKSMLITRGLVEMGRFAAALGGDPMTFLGLAGVGDLVVTCSTPLSRNYRVGYQIGKGGDLSEALSNMDQVAEGVNTLRLVKHKADELNIYMPIVQGLYAIIYEGVELSSVVQTLMRGSQNSDVEFAFNQSGDN